MSAPFGFPDWQNQRPLDGPPLIQTIAVAHNAQFVHPTVFVGRWARLAGSMFIGQNPCRVTLNWLTAQAGGALIGQRVFVLDPLVTVPAVVMIPNLGPWLQVIVANTGGANYDETFVLFGTNRDSLVEFIPSGPLLERFTNVAIGAGITRQDWLTGYYAGPARIWCTGTQDFTVSVFNEADTATMQQIVEIPIVAGGELREEITLPPGANRFDVRNRAGVAGNYWASLTPSYSGA